MILLGYTFMIISILCLISSIPILVFLKDKDRKEHALATINYIAAFATIISLCAAISFYCFDKAQENKQRIRNEKQALFLAKEEIKSNIEVIKKNLGYLAQELKVIDEEKSVVIPLELLTNNSSLLLRTYIPESISNDENVIVMLRKANLLIGEINEIMRSRETYRVHNLAMSNYHSRLKIYDEVLLRRLNSLKENLEKLLEQLSL